MTFPSVCTKCGRPKATPAGAPNGECYDWSDHGRRECSLVATAYQRGDKELHRRRFWARSHAQIRRTFFRDVAIQFYQHARACRLEGQDTTATGFECAAYMAETASNA